MPMRLKTTLLLPVGLCTLPFLWFACSKPAPVASTPAPAETAQAQLAAGFDKTLHPFIKTYCIECHGAKDPEAELDLSAYTDLASIAKDSDRWHQVLERVEAGEMPPDDAKVQPTKEQKQPVVAWLQAMHAAEVQRTAGDPGIVLARRLSNAEYDYTIRDLTGVDIKPTKEFPVDPANTAGFDNSGESLAMSPALVQKYLDAARKVADHLVFTPDGFTFAPYTATTDEDLDKYATNRVVDFYKRQGVSIANRFDHYMAQSLDYAKFFAAAWRFQHRTALGRSGATLADFAQEAKISPKYLATVWTALNEPAGSVGPIAAMQARWKNLPPPSGDKEPEALQSGCVALRDFILNVRPLVRMKFENLVPNGRIVATGSQTVVLWKDRQYAENRTTYAGNAPTLDLGAGGLDEAEKRLLRTMAENSREGSGGRTPVAASEEAVKLTEAREAALIQEGYLQRTGQGGRLLTAKGSAAVGFTKLIETDPALAVPVGDESRARYEESFKRFSAVFPDAFVVYVRARMFLGNQRDILSDLEGQRLLTAGFHSQMGYFRDDQPLYDLVLNADQQRELDRLWSEFNFITRAPFRQLKDFIWFERAEPPSIMVDPAFAEFRAADDDLLSEPKIKRLAEVYLARAEKTRVAIPPPGQNQGIPLSYRAPAPGAVEPIPPGYSEFKLSDAALQAIRDYFTDMNAKIRALEQARRDAEPLQLKALVAFAERASRRPFSAAEQQDLLAFYGTLRKQELSHEEAIRDSVVSVLMSPGFAYRYDLPKKDPALIAAEVQPLSDFELANRLSYFLWSSMPDAELLARAAAGDLRKPEVLLAQAKRLLRDPKVRGFATEFAGNWLDIRRFEEHNAVDRERFPTFTSELREAMFEEPIRFTADLMQRNGSVLDFVYGEHTFVNGTLAKHYGMPQPASPTEWVRVNDAKNYQRGGLLPMSAFLTKNAPGLRTSPVKRGHWVVTKILGQRIPAPPPDIPVLPMDETKLGDLTLRQTLAKHREDKSCASCHNKFDSYGLVFEGFGPVGEARTTDLAGRPAETTAVFPDGSEGSGLAGLQTYLRTKVEHEFLDNLCRKLMVYALGRSLIPSDDLVVTAMRQKLSAGDFRFDTLVEELVTSRQFLTKRVSLDSKLSLAQ